MQGWKMQDGKMQHQTAMVENAGLENAGPICKGGKCGTEKCGTNMQGWKMRDNRVWKACLRISVPKLILECKNDIGLSSFDTVMSNSCTIYFVFTYVFSMCLLSAVFMDLFLRILTDVAVWSKTSEQTHVVRIIISVIKMNRKK